MKTKKKSISQILGPLAIPLIALGILVIFNLIRDPEFFKVAITHKFGDMQLDFPEIEVDNGEDWEVQLDGLTVRCTGRWKGMQAYETELDENGYVLRCEESDSPSTEEKPADYSGYTVPTPQPDGKPWIWGNGFAPEAYWERIAEAMEANGVTFDNLQGKIAEWTEQYGELEDEGDWPQDLFVIGYVLTAIRPGSRKSQRSQRKRLKPLRCRRSMRQRTRNGWTHRRSLPSCGITASTSITGSNGKSRPGGPTSWKTATEPGSPKAL